MLYVRPGRPSTSSGSGSGIQSLRLPELTSIVKQQGVGAATCIRHAHREPGLAAAGLDHATAFWRGRVVPTVLSDPPSPDNDPAFVRSVCFTPCDQMVVAASEDTTLRLWSIESRRLVHTFKAHTADVNAVDCIGGPATPSGPQFVSGGSDGIAMIWDLGTGKWATRVQLPTPADDPSGFAEIMSVAYSPDGRQIALGTLDRAVRLFDVRSVSVHSPSLIPLPTRPLPTFEPTP